MIHHKYSEEEKDFLRENIGKYTYEQLADALNTKFGLNVSCSSVSDLCTKRLKIHRQTNSGKFQKGKPKSVNKSVGQEVLRNGYWFVKVNDKYHEGKLSYTELKENWKPKHRVIYEQAFGKIPQGNIVIFLDGNIENFDINNLYCVNRATHGMMCQNNWYTDNSQNTLTAIKWCELFYALKESKR